MSNDFDGKVLNPIGIEIDLPFWVFKRLTKLHLLERDRATGMRRIPERVFGLMELWQGPDFRHDRRFRPSDPSYQRACSKDSGYSSAFLIALGRDCSGLANPAIERTHDFESDIGHSRISDEFRGIRAEEAVTAARAKRRGRIAWRRRTGAKSQTGTPPTGIRDRNRHNPVLRTLTMRRVSFDDGVSAKDSAP